MIIPTFLRDLYHKIYFSKSNKKKLKIKIFDHVIKIDNQIELNNYNDDFNLNINKLINKKIFLLRIILIN